MSPWEIPRVVSWNISKFYKCQVCIMFGYNYDNNKSGLVENYVSGESSQTKLIAKQSRVL